MNLQWDPLCETIVDASVITKMWISTFKWIADFLLQISTLLVLATRDLPIKWPSRIATTTTITTIITTITIIAIITITIIRRGPNWVRLRLVEANYTIFRITTIAIPTVAIQSKSTIQYPFPSSCNLSKNNPTKFSYPNHCSFATIITRITIITILIITVMAIETTKEVRKPILLFNTNLPF